MFPYRFVSGQLPITSADGQPRTVPNFLRGTLSQSFADLNCVAPDTLQSPMPTRCINYRTCGTKDQLEKKAEIAGSIQAVKDSAVRYAGSLQRERNAALNPIYNESDPELITID